MTFNQNDRPGVAASDRRSSDRDSSSGVVAIDLVGAARTGIIEDTSATGLFLVLDSPLDVVVQIPGASKPMTGKLVRVTALPGNKSGVGIELVGDPS